jgi:hypothetical protein
MVVGSTQFYPLIVVVGPPQSCPLIVVVGPSQFCPFIVVVGAPQSCPLIAVSLESTYKIYYLLTVKNENYHGKKLPQQNQFYRSKNTLLFTIR